jgi:hypothetical protein
MKHYAIKAYDGVVVQIHILLTSALVEGEWLASRPGLFTPGERAQGTHWIGGWVGSRARLVDLEKRKFLTIPGFGTPTLPVATPTTLSRLPMMIFPLLLTYLRTELSPS